MRVALVLTMLLCACGTPRRAVRDDDRLGAGVVDRIESAMLKTGWSGGFKVGSLAAATGGVVALADEREAAGAGLLIGAGVSLGVAWLLDLSASRDLLEIRRGWREREARREAPGDRKPPPPKKVAPPPKRDHERDVRD